MANSDYAIYVDDDGSGNLAYQVFRDPGTRPSGGTRLSYGNFAENSAQSGTPVAVTGATNATPIVITAAGHGLSVGDWAYVQSVGGNTAANGSFMVSAVSGDDVTLRDSSGNGSYTSGGYIRELAKTKNMRTALEMGLFSVVADKAAGN